jgi:elongator complex protein 3
MQNSAIDTIINELATKPSLSESEISRIFMRNPGNDGKVYSKSTILKEFNLHPVADSEARQTFLRNITMKKIRTLSGVTTVTVLTKPFACPGKCIFCPNDVKMPKSYISSEPGAQRAKANAFDPYLQTYNRLLALQKIGHPTDKVELIILGGTWTAYPEKYQIWFVKRCFDALNDFGTENVEQSLQTNTYEFSEVTDDKGKINYNLSVSQPPDKKQIAKWDALYEAHQKNELAQSRCVGLSIETRPDEINPAEVKKIRSLGATKVQLGVQSLDDRILSLNKRGHDVAQTAYAFALLRKAGFKIQVHYMPNLYGATPQTDIADFAKLFDDERFRPDEVKLYPCSLIDGTELMDYYHKKLWRPYNRDELLEVVSSSLQKVPEYCRVTRVIRDIPGQEIVDGNKETNFRQAVEKTLSGLNEIRSREIRNKKIDPLSLKLRKLQYETSTATEFFLQFTTDTNEIAAFLRLSLPKEQTEISELQKCAMIREVHVYGASLEIGQEKTGSSQHVGLGTKLILEACSIANLKGYPKIAVISSIGTREYYKRFGFVLKDLYQIKDLKL